MTPILRQNNMVDSHCFLQRLFSYPGKGDQMSENEDARDTRGTFELFAARLKERRKESEADRDSRAARIEFYRRVARR